MPVCTYSNFLLDANILQLAQMEPESDDGLCVCICKHADREELCAGNNSTRLQALHIKSLSPPEHTWMKKRQVV